MSSVSVVIPCYKYGHFLEEAVSSVLDDQPGVDVRVLVIDDASPDDSAEQALKIAARDPRVEVLVHEANKGNIATYNEGLLEWADGDYCVLMSADDRLTPGALRRARDLLDAHPEVGFVYGHARWFWQDRPTPTARTTLRGWSVWPGEWWLERRLRQGENCITSPEVVVRTALQKRVGGYDPALPHAGDQEMWMRLAANGDVGFLRGVDQAFYRVHGQNMRTSFSQLMDLRQKRQAFDVTFDLYGDRLSDRRRLRDGVRRRLSREALFIAARSYDLGTADPQVVDELVEFALDCWPAANRLPAYHTLRLRRRLDPTLVARVQPSRPAAFGRRAHGWLQRRSWKYRGF
jgi:glycosyltransferase involved in cell wall biosynthesis